MENVKELCKTEERISACVSIGPTCNQYKCIKFLQKTKQAQMSKHPNNEQKTEAKRLKHNPGTRKRKKNEMSRQYDGVIKPPDWREYDRHIVKCTLETGKLVKGCLFAKGKSKKNPSIRTISGRKYWLNKSSVATPLCSRPSKEQQKIIDAMLSDKDTSVLCASVAGSGKTTTVLHIVDKMQRRDSRMIWMLTYSKDLKMDSRQRGKKHQLDNLVVDSYHSFFNVADIQCHNDKHLKDILMDQNKLERVFEKKGNVWLLVLDEQQDCTPLYYAAIKTIVDRCHPHQMLVIGDKKQEIYSFKGADHRFLTLAKNLYPKFVWEEYQLTISFRITKSIACFMRAVDPDCRIQHNVSKTEDAPVLFLVGKKYIVEEIQSLVSRGVKPSEIYVLCASVKKNFLVKDIANELSRGGLGVFYPMTDFSVGNNPNYTDGKIWFGTLHGSKGREAKYVFVFNFGHDYVQHFLKDDSSKINASRELPNPLSVGVSRAILQLFICFEDKKKKTPNEHWLRMLPTLPVEKVKMLQQNKTIEIRGARINDFKDFIPNDSKQKLKYAVTELVDRVSGDLLDEFANGIEQETIWEPGTHLKLNGELQSNVKGCNMEPLHFLPGIIVPALFICNNDWKRFKELFLPKCSDSIVHSLKSDWQEKYKEIRDDKILDRRSWQESASFHEDLAFLSLVHVQNKEDLATRAHQVNISDLARIVSIEEMKKAMIRFGELKTQCNVLDLNFEYEVGINEERNDIMYDIKGAIDAVDPSQNNIFEFKCTNELQPKHVLQVMMYAYLYVKSATRSITDVYLFNVKTRELRRITYDEEVARTIILRLLAVKNYTPSTKDDENFIAEACRLAANPGAIELRE